MVDVATIIWGGTLEYVTHKDTEKSFVNEKQ